MRPRRFTLGPATLVVTLCSAIVWASTQNALPKYNATGQLVDSVIHDVNGNVGVGTNIPQSRLHVSLSSVAEGATVATIFGNSNSAGKYLLDVNNEVQTVVRVRADGTSASAPRPPTRGFAYQGERFRSTTTSHFNGGMSRIRPIRVHSSLIPATT